MILVDKYSDCVKQLDIQKRDFNAECKICVLHDNGLLPAHVLSPISYFQSVENKKIYQEKDIYYDFLEIPDFWAIRTDAGNGAVYNMGEKVATIYFKPPMDKRNVYKVEWCTQTGWIYKIDYYGKYGIKHASEFLNQEKNVESRVFYSDGNQEVIVEQPACGTITLLHHGAVEAFFHSWKDFYCYYLEKAGYSECESLMVENMEQLELIQQYGFGEKDFKYICFLDPALMNQYILSGGKNGRRIYEIPDSYPENRARAEVCILTNSDQIDGVEYMIKKLTDVRFHIAAVTQMSEKLMSLAAYENVNLYPQIAMSQIEKIWEKCDFYLDINQYDEICDAINNAHKNNLLILGYDGTVHQRELMNSECIFQDGQYDKLIAKLIHVINHPFLTNQLLEIQQNQRIRTWEGI